MNEFVDTFGYLSMLCLRGVGVLAGVLLAAWLVPKFARLIYELQQKQELHQVKLQAAAVALEQQRAEVARYVLDHGVIRARPNELVIPREMLAETVAGQMRLVLAQIEAQRAPDAVPTTIHYAPHYARLDAPAAPQIEAHDEAAPVIPTFAELLQGESLGHGRFLLGCDLATGQPIIGSWKELYSTALGGLSGTGKSTTARFLLSQAALNDCRFVVLDPHAGAGEDSLAATLAPLHASMLCEPASENRQILDAARHVDDMGRRRINGDSDRTPVIVCIDEATALLSRSSVGGLLGELIETIAQEYRKVGIFALCSAQIWLAQRSGGNSALRDSFASAYVHRMKRNQARLLLPTDDARHVETLGTGQAVLWRTSGETQTIVIPNTTAADVETVARRIGVAGKVQNQLSTLENRAFGGDSPKADLAPVFDADPRHLRVIEAFEAGETLRQIATDVYGVSGGANYNAALGEVQDVLRNYLSQLKRGNGG